MAIYTIGYERLAFNDFMSLLQRNHIETVVDIRELPLSRKPGFSKRALRDALNISGLEYVHVPDQPSDCCPFCSPHTARRNHERRKIRSKLDRSIHIRGRRPPLVGYP